MLRLIKYNRKEIGEWFYIFLLIICAIAITPKSIEIILDSFFGVNEIDANCYFIVGNIFRYFFVMLVFLINISNIKDGIVADKIQKGYKRVEILLAFEITLTVMLLIMLTLEMFCVHYFQFNINTS
ncbi:MAG: hypothetical protein K6G26_10085 [Lachnospiraceae bacterium]|nr:hypothetical protein [Lachnospiraceae bacterium]